MLAVPMIVIFSMNSSNYIMLIGAVQSIDFLHVAIQTTNKG